MDSPTGTSLIEKPASSSAAALAAPIRDEVIDELLAGRPLTAASISGPDGLVSELVKRLVERMIAAELDDHLGYQHGSSPSPEQLNRRNGTTPKTLLTTHGAVRIDAPRDRDGSFEPQIISKGDRRFHGFDEKIIALYAGGMTVREIQRHLQAIYGVEVSPDLVSRVTDAVLDDLREWRSRPLDAVYPVVYLDCLVVTIREAGHNRRRAVYLAIGVDLDGARHVLGLWISPNEGAKFWLSVLNDLKQRGLEDVLVCCTDGLKGFPEAIEAVYPNAWIQTCIVHLIRLSLRFVPDKHRRAVAAALKPIYTATDPDTAKQALTAFTAEWDTMFPQISRAWQDAWDRVTPFLAFPADVRRILYTTNTIESLNRQLRKTIKTRGAFPTEDACLKLLYLAITDAETRWRTCYNWGQALMAFRIHFGDRIPATA
jgi:transposase-like protein